MVMAPGDLLHRWRRMLEPWGSTDDEIEEAGQALLDRYGEPHRRYHTVEHLFEVLTMVGDLVDMAAQPAAVEFAAWFHDAVYDPRAAGGANELASEGLAVSVMGRLLVSPATIEPTRRLIGMTAGHLVQPGDIDAAVLADADLWILAAPQGRYRRYVADVRGEYGWLDDRAWRTGRSAVISGFLGRPRLFSTDRAHLALEDRARDNLGWELAALSGREAQP